MILPSGVRFFSLREEATLLREGGYGDGSEDEEVLAGVFRRPRGSFR